MAEDSVNLGRRRFLTATTAVVGGAGICVAAVPFIKAWNPSAKAKLAGQPVVADISKLEEGERLMFEWRGQPIWIINRSQAALAALPSVEGKLKDPKSETLDQQPGYAKNEYRSIKPQILVLVGICTHLGCAPLYIPELEPQAFDSEWKGGFFCPCHKSKFDLAGRVYQGVPAPTNLVVPPHRFVDDGTIEIGVSAEGADTKGAA